MRSHICTMRVSRSCDYRVYTIPRSMPGSKHHTATRAQRAIHHSDTILGGARTSAFTYGASVGKGKICHRGIGSKINRGYNPVTARASASETSGFGYNQDLEDTRTVLSAGCRAAESRARVHAANIKVNLDSPDLGERWLLTDPLSEILLRECEEAMGPSGSNSDSAALASPSAADVAEAVMTRALDQIVLQSVLGLEAKLRSEGAVPPIPLQVRITTHNLFRN
jgi:hypothetical protein